MTRESPFCKRDEIADSPTHLSRAFLAQASFWRFSITATFLPCGLVRRGSPDPAVRLTEGLQVTRRAANRCEYCRLSQEGQEASFPIDHITPSARGNATKPAHLTLACVSSPPARNWVRSACPIPPWFVVSFALSMTSTRANWLRSASSQKRLLGGLFDLTLGKVLPGAS